MGESRASKNVIYQALGKLKYVSSKIKQKVKSKISERRNIQKLWEQDFNSGKGTSSDTIWDVKKRHNLK